MDDILMIEAVCVGQCVNCIVIIYKPVRRMVHAASFRKVRTMKGNATSKRAAFTLVEIMIVVAIIGLLAAIAIPNFVRARATSQANACINNLNKIENASDEFALETGKKTGDDVTYPGDLTPYIKLNATSSIPPCPASGTYTCDKIGKLPRCSLSTTVTPAHQLQ